MLNARIFKLVPRGLAGVLANVALRLGALAGQVAALLFVAHVLGAMLAGRFDSAASGIALATCCLAAFIALRTAARYVASKKGSAAVRCVRAALFDKLVGLGLSYREHASASEVSYLLGEGVEQLSPYFSAYLPQLVYAIAAPLALSVCIATFDVPAALVLLVCVVLMPASTMMFMKRAKGFMGRYQGSYIDLGGAFHEAIRGLTTLKVFASDARKHEQLNEQAETFRRATMRLLRVQLTSITLMDLFAYGGMAASAAVAAVHLAAGALSPSAAAGVALVAPCAVLPMRTFGSLFHTGMNANAAIERIFAFLDAPEPDFGRDALDDGAAFDGNAGITCSGLGYAVAGRRVLDGVNLTVPAGAFVGVTGESGAGKSTLAKLLCGECASYSGSATLFGCEVSGLSRKRLREMVTLVSAESHVFAGTVRSNLLIADPTASDGRLWEALGKAKLDEFVHACGGLDVAVGAGGANLSGGQRQRLCFARALLRDTPFYIFDEAASNVDAKSESVLLEAMQQLALTKTVVVITHRLSSLVWADGIYVLEQGRVAQSGTHRELLAVDGAYRALWERNAELEEFAARIADSGDGEATQLSEAERAMRDMGGMGAMMMQMAMDARKAQRYRNAGGADAQGHPAWIPLPDYAQYRPQDAGEQPQSDTAIPVGTSAEAPRPQSVFATVAGMAALTSGQIAEQVGAVLLGAASSLAFIGLFAFAAGALLAACGAFVPLGFHGSVAAALVCAVVRGPLHYAERLFTHDQTFKTLACVRDRVFAAMRRLAPAVLEQRGSADLVSLLTSDVELLEGFYSRVLTPLASTVLSSLAVCACLLVVSPPLAALALAAYLLVAMIVPALAAAATKNRARILRGYAALMADFVADTLDGIQDLLRFGRARQFSDELGEHFASADGANKGFTFATSLFATLPRALALFSGVAFAFSACALAGQAEFSAAAALVATFAYFASLEPIVALGEAGAQLHRTLAAARRVLDFLEQQPETDDVAGGAVPDEFTGLDVEDVSFRYATRRVLRKFSAAVHPGRVVRVTGESGAGKSTLVKLVMRFWDVEKGRICISGNDLRSVSTSALRSLQGYMTQDTFLFDATLRENLLSARPDASDEQIARAIEAAALARFAGDLPSGLDTVLGKGGVQLSSGERQRLGLARVFLQDAPLLLLDEPTSNLDSLNEAAVIYALARCGEDKTMVVVSHRSTAAAIADETITLQRL